MQRIESPEWCGYQTLSIPGTALCGVNSFLVGAACLDSYILLKLGLVVGHVQ